MTQDELIAAVQAQANDFTDPFKQRIEATIPLGVALFISEHQWEFLDKYITTSCALDATTGRYVITPPSDLFKVVTMYTEDGGEIAYQNRASWLEAVLNETSSSPPTCYTVIGTDMFVSGIPDSSTVYMVYTRDATTTTLGDIPGQYHPAIVQAVVTWLMPAVLQDPAGGQVPNPLYQASVRRYNESVAKAVGLELQHKGRVLTLAPTELQELRNEFDR